ncbi:MAG: hypothetical protein IJN68_01660 [Clostridia bacterium]|nr:hypothetical protein [Clostridia bacterium]
MHWRFRKPTYDILVPNLEKSIFKLNEDEAAAYFDWFMDQVPQRVAYVSNICAKELKIPLYCMDCSPESLLLLWKWFRKRAKTELVELSSTDTEHPNYSNGTFCNKRQLTLETEYIVRDVGMYLAETFRKEHPQIYWSYYTEPKRSFFVNHPILRGFVDMTTGNPFDAEFEPIHMTGIQAKKILLNKSKDTDLFDIYTIWSKKCEPIGNQSGDGL